MHIPSEAEQRRHWRLMWLSSLQAFGDSETQQKRWLDPMERNPHYSLVECMCCYFDDAFLGEENAYEKRLDRGHITAEEAAAVADFHSLAKAYKSPSGDDWDAEAVLHDPGWRNVVDAARRAQERLQPLLTDSTEVAALTQPLQWETGEASFHTALTGSTIVPAGKWIADQKNGGFGEILGGLWRRLFGSRT
jgi:hypothetical protein